MNKPAGKRLNRLGICLTAGLFLALLSAMSYAQNTYPPAIDLMGVTYSGTGTVTVTLTVITNKHATCRYDTQDVPFSGMNHSMDGSRIQHTGSLSYTRDTPGEYYVLCRDDSGNTMYSSNSISFNADVTESSSDSGGSGGGNGSCTESWTCTDWGECKEDFQTRKCYDSNKCGTEIIKPKEFQTCKKSCEELWQCDSWGVCSEGRMGRACYDLNDCGTEYFKPAEYEECGFIPECYNLVQDNGEEGVDCGGRCPACETCFDRVQNQNETGIDCGGHCRPCRTGDIIATGKNILVFPAYTPGKPELLMFALILSLTFMAVKNFYNFKKII
ncbi:hypothetical protein KY347_04350 [Candidatus Woesearchaeota archaeon]|nr:hypothetical protein [Candidatus Woesearchaeota archaeon]